MSTNAWATLTYENKITGIEGDILKNVENRLVLDKKYAGKALTKTSIEDLYSDGPKNIHTALKAFGYFKLTIKSKLTHTKDNWVAEYHITLGPQLKVTNLSVSIVGPGKNDEAFNEAFKKLLHDFPLKTNDPLTTEKYDSAKQQLFTIAEKQGYLEPRLQQHIIQIDLKKYTSNVILKFKTGPRFYFGDIKITSKTYSKSFIARFLQFKTGEPYSPMKLIQAQRDLSNSGYFDQVHVTGHTKKTKKQNVPINVHVSPRKPRDYLVGLGYGTYTGPRVTLGYTWRNVTPTGHQLQAFIKASQVQSNYLLSYLIPGHNPITDNYTFQLANQDLDLNHVGRSNVTSLTFAYNHKPSDTFQQTLQVSYEHENSRVDDNDDRTITNMLIPSGLWTYTKADDRILTKNGYRISGFVRGAWEPLLSNVSFIQGKIDLKWIKTFKPLGRTIVRGAFGATAVGAKDLPLSLQFLIGGPQNLRGFRIQRAGNGRYLKFISLEYQQPVYGNWYATIFSDNGAADDHLSANLQRSIGIGVGYYSPLGPIQVTVAQAITKRGKPFSIQFNLGPDL